MHQAPAMEVPNGRLMTGRIVRVTVTSATDAGEKKWASIREAAITVLRDGKAVKWILRPSSQTDSHADDFAAVGFDDNAWHDLPVPSNWEVLGYFPADLLRP